MAAAESSSSVVSAVRSLTTLLSKLGNRANSEGRTEAGYIFFNSLGEQFLYGCQRDSGRVSVSKRFRLCSTGGTLG